MSELVPCCFRRDGFILAFSGTERATHKEWLKTGSSLRKILDGLELTSVVETLTLDSPVWDLDGVANLKGILVDVKGVMYRSDGGKEIKLPYRDYVRYGRRDTFVMAVKT